MARAKIVRDGEGRFYAIQFKCPGCATEEGDFGKHAGLINLPVSWRPPGEGESTHAQGKPHWTFNGDFERPTFGPSVLTRWREWMEDDVPAKEHVCHSFVRNGRIEFLTDCTHALAGKTVDLPEID